jgi:hypothetical protein
MKNKAASFTEFSYIQASSAESVMRGKVKKRGGEEVT